MADKSCRLGMALIMKCRYLLWVLEWAHNYTLIRVRIPLIYDAPPPGLLPRVGAKSCVGVIVVIIRIRILAYTYIMRACMSYRVLVRSGPSNNYIDGT